MTTLDSNHNIRQDKDDGVGALRIVGELRHGAGSNASRPFTGRGGPPNVRQ